ncbi:ligase-associated DNA damage response exonuclease [Coralloluteibacterium stylophorae]|uniref:ligase-associated DNA damage response exonuclease n=1 Tax=Coralloluteibacterium stylophorae TaxID=1776034 RepID=UPI0030845ADC
MPNGPLIELRAEGLYCPAGDFHIDPWRPVPRAVITHGHGDHARAGSGTYHLASAGLPILEWRLGAQDYRTHAYGEAFDLGGVRVSLHPAGHVLGSAQVRVEAGDRVWVASGDYKRDPDPTCAPFEPVRCDAFITEATFGLPIYRWRPTREVAAEILAWWQGCRARGETAVLFAYALGKAQRVLAELAALVPEAERAAHRVLLHGAMAQGVRIYREAGIAMLPTEPLSEQPEGRRPRTDAFAGDLVLAPPSAAGSAWMRRFRRASLGFASGWMRVRGSRRRRGYDRGFVISDHADWPSLLRTVEDTGARQVFATHGDTAALVRVLCERGIDARTLRTEYGDEDEAP